MFRHGTMAFLPPEVPFFVHGLIRMAGACSSPALCSASWPVGITGTPAWARMIGHHSGCFNLIEYALRDRAGVYTLWTLLPAKSEEEYRQISKAA